MPSSFLQNILAFDQQCINRWGYEPSAGPSGPYLADTDEKVAAIVRR